MHTKNYFYLFYKPRIGLDIHQLNLFKYVAVNLSVCCNISLFNGCLIFIGVSSYLQNTSFYLNRTAKLPHCHWILAALLYITTMRLKIATSRVRKHCSFYCVFKYSNLRNEK